MHPSYVRAIATVDRVLKSKGQTVIVRTKTATGLRVSKVPAAVFDIELKLVDGKTIEVGDKKLLMSAVGLSAPVGPLTEIEIGKVVHTVIDPGAFAPAGDVLFYDAIIRSGG